MMARPVVTTTFDTEGDNFLAKSRWVPTGNLRLLSQFHQFCKKYNFKLIRLTDHEMAVAAESLEFALDIFDLPAPDETASFQELHCCSDRGFGGDHINITAIHFVSTSSGEGSVPYSPVQIVRGYMVSLPGPKRATYGVFSAAAMCISTESPPRKKHA